MDRPHRVERGAAAAEARSSHGAALLLACMVAAGAPASTAAADVGAADRTIVPGLMGYNALPTVPVADAKVDDDLLLELQIATQGSAPFGGRDAALTPYTRLVVPFRGFAALEVDAVPVELWRVSPETQARLGTPSASGLSRGDVRFGARFTLVDEGEHHPAFGLHFMTKTASGKSFDERRFTDAPGYVFDVLFAKGFPWRVGPFATVRALAKVGIAVWQQGSHWQDDALDAGAALQLRSRGGSRLELQWRAYWGYERFDSPSVLGLTYVHRATRALGLLATANRGLTSDAPAWELRAGIVVHVDTRSIPVVGTALSGSEPPKPHEQPEAPPRDGGREATAPGSPAGEDSGTAEHGQPPS